MPAQPPDAPTSHKDAGDGVVLTTDTARAGQRSGRVIWILVISTILAAVILLGLFGGLAGKKSAGDKNGNERATHASDVSTFQAPQPSPKQAPPDMPSTTGQTTVDATNNGAGR